MKILKFKLISFPERKSYFSCVHQLLTFTIQPWICHSDCTLSKMTIKRLQSHQFNMVRFFFWVKVRSSGQQTWITIERSCVRISYNARWKWFQSHARPDFCTQSWLSHQRRKMHFFNFVYKWRHTCDVFDPLSSTGLL
jgi:hypothetical protein